MGHYGRKPNRMTDSASGEYIRLYTSMIFIIVIRHKKKKVLDVWVGLDLR